ncbi:DUF421 domain-containing protein [Acetivibrio sp. MSJd-27]|uniref:YetF domain-containing protein n=1 Tax=Acetivibrio sp. MSJd-27 TaxID=2841523 RepID=UPI0015B09A86|nr:DUF421 domain-containing protein [Acetivibrio sp. MSJd-27]MBU5450138.1 DUF421 domain-containing protein [Acetivibrio sp. MSJd-27]
MEGLIDSLDIIGRSLLSIAVLFLVTKLMGKKQVSQLNTFDYIIGISIGSIAAALSVDQDTEHLDAMISMFVYGLISLMISFLTLKSIRFRRFISGTPTVLIQHGKILEKGIKKSKIDLNDLMEECRESGYFNLADIEFAVMEVDGTVSILPKKDKAPVTCGDMNIQGQQEGLVANLIIDGKIMENNLKLVRKDRDWLEAQLRHQKITNPADVLLATLDNQGHLSVYHRDIHEKSFDVLQ